MFRTVSNEYELNIDIGKMDIFIKLEYNICELNISRNSINVAGKMFQTK